VSISYVPIPNGFRLSTRKDVFTILQITDLHLAERYFLKVSQLRRLRRLIDSVNPDLIVNTGDFFCRRRLLHPRLIVKLFTSIIGKDYPWTFAWGNHDCEAFQKGFWFLPLDTEEEFKKFEDFLSKTQNCLYAPSHDFIMHYGEMSPGEKELEEEAFCYDGFYGGNFKLELYNASQNMKAWDIFILNSRQVYHIPPQALLWMEHEVRRNPQPVPAVCFFHLPNKAFQELWEAGLAQGVKGEGVQYLKDNGRIHEAFKRMGMVRACFAGHDHKNDFMGTYEGITYVYGRKTLRFSKGAVDAGKPLLRPIGKSFPLEWGAKLITLGMTKESPMDNTFSVSTILDSSRTCGIPYPLPVSEPNGL